MKNITIGIIAKDKNIDNQNFQVISKNNLKYIHNKIGAAQAQGALSQIGNSFTNKESEINEKNKQYL